MGLGLPLSLFSRCIYFCDLISAQPTSISHTSAPTPPHPYSPPLHSTPPASPFPPPLFLCRPGGWSVGRGRRSAHGARWGLTRVRTGEKRNNLEGRNIIFFVLNSNTYLLHPLAHNLTHICNSLSVNENCSAKVLNTLLNAVNVVEKHYDP